tara:strand:- start:1028 stop:1741 length:714 start_codon:yes stop_codon:yes gene_type:complete
MALHHNPRIVTSGLEIMLDPADSNSYPGSGTLWNDLSGTVQAAALQGATGYSTANQGTLDFDGTDDYVRVYPDISTDYNSGNFTWSLWVKPDQLAKQTFLVKCWRPNIARYDNETGFGFEWQAGNGNQTIIITLPSSRTTYGRWFNLVARVDGSGVMKFDVFDPENNSQQSSTKTSGTYPGGSTSTDVHYLGLQGWWGGTRDQKFLGLMGPYMKYNRSITDEEVLQNYEVIKTRFGY